jgi:hypothetical protein
MPRQSRYIGGWVCDTVGCGGDNYHYRWICYRCGAAVPDKNDARKTNSSRINSNDINMFVIREKRRREDDNDEIEVLKTMKTVKYIHTYQWQQFQ